LTRINFQKWEATGNDFVFIDSLSEGVQPSDIPTERIVTICDRKSGQGADGVVFFERRSDGPSNMAIINSDGSRADMCGNALRCLARILYSQSGQGSHRVKIANRVVEVRAATAGEPSVVMGPALAMAGAPLFAEQADLAAVAGKAGYLLSFGNPHFVVPCESLPENWEEIGSRLQPEADRIFGEGGINCGFLVTQLDSNGDYPLRVFERGAGATQSCGSGACAASAVLEHVLNIPPPHRLALTGGSLTVERQGSQFVLQGPANMEYESHLEI